MSAAPAHMASARVPGRSCHHDVRTAKPVGHIVNETLDYRPIPSGPSLKPAHPSLDPLVATADRHYVEVFQAATGQCPDLPAQTACALGATRDDDDEGLVAEPEGVPKFGSFPPEKRSRPS